MIENLALEIVHPQLVLQTHHWLCVHELINIAELLASLEDYAKKKKKRIIHVK